MYGTYVYVILKEPVEDSVMLRYIGDAKHLLKYIIAGDMQNRLKTHCLYGQVANPEGVPR